MKNKHLFICSLLALFLVSCEREELPVSKHERGDVTERQVAMGSDYKDQIWYDLESDQIVSVNLSTDWDLSFDCDKETHRIFLNSSLYMQAAVANSTVWEEVTTNKNLAYKVDLPYIDIDSLALGEWLGKNRIYVIDRGYNESGTALGFKKLQVTAYSGEAYTIRYADLNGKNENTVTITKNVLYNTIAFSFKTNNTLFIEPQKDKYDFYFTQYTLMFYDPIQPYRVTGVLLNRSNVEVAFVNTNDFQSITIDSTLNHTFSSSLGAIGYDWKLYNLSGGTYQVFPNYVYIVKTRSGFYYKLHFIDFYDHEGVKGSPKFEFQKL